MKLLLFRHAEKDTSTWNSSPQLGPGLTERGQRQADKIAEAVLQHRLPQPRMLISSPKLRAQQTFQKTAEACRLPLNICDWLDERGHNEGRVEYETRLSTALETLSKWSWEQGVVFAVTHSDVVEFMSQGQLLASGHYLEIEISKQNIGKSKTEAIEDLDWNWKIIKEGGFSP